MAATIYYDNDADLDILLTGDTQPAQESICRVYRNDAGSFVEAASVPGSRSARAVAGTASAPASATSRTAMNDAASGLRCVHRPSRSHGRVGRAATGRCGYATGASRPWPKASRSTAGRRWTRWA